MKYNNLLDFSVYHPMICAASMQKKNALDRGVALLAWNRC